MQLLAVFSNVDKVPILCTPLKEFISTAEMQEVILYTKSERCFKREGSKCIHFLFRKNMFH